jgi:acyl-CoA synthetase (AMP-forming)/AMP-acid ligase II
VPQVTAQVGERQSQLVPLPGAVSTSAATPPTEAELADFCRARLAPYKIPTRWLFTSTFPLTATGKIRKDVLSAQLAQASTP